MIDEEEQPIRHTWAIDSLQISSPSPNEKRENALKLNILSSPKFADQTRVNNSQQQGIYLNSNRTGTSSYVPLRVKTPSKERLKNKNNNSSEKTQKKFK